MLEIPLGDAQSGEIAEVRLYKSGTTVTNAQFRIHFFLRVPTIGAGDDAALSLTPVDIIDAIGRWDVTIDQAYANGAYGTGNPTAGGARTPFRQMFPKDAVGNSYSLWAAIEARAGYQRAASEVFRIRALIYRTS